MRALCAAEAGGTRPPPPRPPDCALGLKSCWLLISSALFELLDALDADVKGRAAALAIDGTSATTLLLDAEDGTLLAPPLVYNIAQPCESVEYAKSIAPPDHTATASTSSLCKVITWHQQQLWQDAAADGRSPVILDHASWAASLLHGERRATDYNNALKLGYDPGGEVYPEWLVEQVSWWWLQLAILLWPACRHMPVASWSAGWGAPHPCLGQGGRCVKEGEERAVASCCGLPAVACHPALPSRCLNFNL